MNSETEKYLSELEQLANKATPAPWMIDDRVQSKKMMVVTDNVDDEESTIATVTNKDDKFFIAAAREAIPKLIDMVKALDVEAYYLAERVGDHGRCPKWERLKISCVHKVCTPENRMNCWRAEARRWRKSDD